MTLYKTIIDLSTSFHVEPWGTYVKGGWGPGGLGIWEAGCGERFNYKEVYF